MKVTLVGAGPGGIGLLTVKGLETLQAADAVLYDRIVSGDILAAIPDSAEKIDVGKRAGFHQMPQDGINALMLEKARQGKNVVRLKGGDPLVFGRGGEELEFLAENGIPFEIVPGVTSATAAAAYAGIPLTLRGRASSFHVITAHAQNNEPPETDFGALAKLNGTLVFLMGVSEIGGICEKCVLAGMDKNMPAAVVENAAAGCQRKFLGTVSTLPEISRKNDVKPPAVVIVGEVCRYSERYDWFIKKPLRGRRVVIARVKGGASELSERLKELGCDAVEMPFLKIAPLTGPGCALGEKLLDIKKYSWLVFTSAVGVSVFFDYLVGNGIDVRELNGLKIACVGAETEKEANRRGVRAAYVPAEYNGAALARGLTELVKDGERLLVARARGADRDLTRVLADAGVVFDDVPIYEKIRDTGNTGAALSAAAGGGFDFAAFTSPSAVECFAEAAARAQLSMGKIKAVCIAEKTAAAARAHGMEVHIAAAATTSGMVEKIMELCE